jgi:hypothetical protein
MKRFLAPSLLLASLFLLIIGAKFSLIDGYGSDLPYWDQWDGEAANLYRPYLQGKLGVGQLFSAHNEHRIFFTRLFALGLLEINDRQWDARLETVANTVLHASVALLLAAFALRVLPAGGTAIFTGLTALFFGTSVSYENTLFGFQSQFYFLLLFSVLQIAGTFLARPRSWAWWLAPLAGAAALFSMASGLLSALAILLIAAGRAWHDRRITRDDGWIFSANASLCVAGWMLKVEMPGHAYLKAADPWSWLDAWLHQLGWPMPTHWAAPLGLVPPVLLGLAYLRQKIDGPIVWTLLGASAWFWLQTAAIAFGRGAVEYGCASRYCDVFAFGLLVNFLILAFLGTHAVSPVAQRSLLITTVAFIGVTLWGLGQEAGVTNEEALNPMPGINAARIATVRNYVCTHDPSFFAKKPWNELPYPSATSLAELLDTPVLRAVLPSSVRPPIDLVADASSTHDFNRYPLAGPAGDTPSALKAWLAFPAAPPKAPAAHFLSTSFVTDHTRVSLYVASVGHAHLQLIDERGRIHEPLGHLPAIGPNWKRVNFACAKGRYQLEVTPTSPGWLAFTQPFTDTPLSHLARQVVRLGPWLLGFGTMLGVIALGLFARSGTLIAQAKPRVAACSLFSRT